MITRFVSICQFCGRVYGSRLAEAPAGETTKVIASHGPCPSCFATWTAIVRVRQDHSETPVVQRALIQVERVWRATLKQVSKTHHPGEIANEGTPGVSRHSPATSATDPAVNPSGGGVENKE